MKKYFFYLVLMALTMGISCKCNQTDGSSGENDSLTNVNAEKDMNRMLISIPTPLETALFMKQFNIKFDPIILNKVENAGKYTTAKERSLILGIYLADLCYSSVFDNHQATLSYFNVVRKLIEDLGVNQNFDKKMIEEIESKIQDKEFVYQTISSKILTISSSLEGSQKLLGVNIAYGGWIEVLNIFATQIKGKDNQDLALAFAEQKNALNGIMGMYKEFENNLDAKSEIEKLSRLKSLFDKLPSASNELQMADTNQRQNSVIVPVEVPKIKAEELLPIIDEINRMRAEIVRI